VRFGSVHYSAVVFVNGVRVGGHKGGHLPFELDVGKNLRYGRASDRITVAVNNTLTPSSVPQGWLKWKQESAAYPANYRHLEYVSIWGNVIHSLYSLSFPT